MDIRNYLENKITYGWYKNAKIDYDLNGKFIDIKFEKEHLIIIHEEDGQRFETLIGYYKDYTFEQIYNIWMEEEWELAA